MANQRLPPEKDLAAELNVSRNSLREAVRALVLVGVLDVRQGDGTYVTSLEPEVLLEATQFVVGVMPRQRDLELIEARKLIEPASVALATIRMSEIDLAEIEALLSKIRGASGIVELHEADLAFHRRIVAATGNATLTALLSSLTKRAISLHQRRAANDPGALERSLADHEGIYRALVARDPELARAITTLHIGRTEMWLREDIRLGSHDDDTARSTS